MCNKSRSAKNQFVIGRIRRYFENTSGSAAQVFALSALPIFAALGVAVDGARIAQEHANFFAAVDSAALAITADERSAVSSLSGAELSERMALLSQITKDYVTTNYDASSASMGDLTTDLTITGSAVTVTASLEVPMTFMKVFGLDDFTLNAEVTVKKAMRPIELMMVMDTTGSMASGGKITGAKDAAKNLLTTLYSGSLAAEPRSENIRIGLVPFAGAVRLDTAHPDFDLDWIDTTGANPLSKLNFDHAPATPAVWNNYYAWSRLKVNSSTFHTWNGCVEARMRGTAAANTDYNANDIAPASATPATLFPAYFNFDAPSTSFGVSYVSTGTTTTPNTECYQLTSTQCSSTATADRRIKQENYRKYDGTVIGAEAVGASGPWSYCAVSKIVPMTYDRATVEAGINAMTASGPTLIAEGLAWGWRAVSKTEPLTQVQGSGSIPSATLSNYNDVKWRKVIVLMTDGDNDLSAGNFGYNNTVYSAYGTAGEPTANNRFSSTSSSGAIMTALDNEMLNVCSKVKAAGISLYVASFGSGVSTTTKARLQTCSSGTGYYAHAATSSDLITFFNHIGEDVLNKSIYVSN